MKLYPLYAIFVVLALASNYSQSECIKPQQIIEPNKLTAVLGRCDEKKTRGVGPGYESFYTILWRYRRMPN